MFSCRRSTDDFAEEIRAHLETEADQLEAEGLPRAEAERRARVAFGNVTVARERFALRYRVQWLDTGAYPVAVISDRYWRSHFGANL
jgi:hypothetical protein